ncbi:TRADD-N-associated membrane domain-containing protein [Micromonospora sp.]|uniref:TRADD-N-associated membrane domain-containing protein n=1 Tax=Micromonospora sp. TaxID=1876 RepID=UPI003B3B67F4
MTSSEDQESVSASETLQRVPERNSPAFRMAWRTSSERARLQRSGRYIAGAAIAATLLAGIVAFIYERYDDLYGCISYYNGISSEEREECATKAIGSAFDTSFFTLPIAASIAALFTLYFHLLQGRVLRRELADRLAYEAAQQKLAAVEGAVYGRAAETATLELSPLWTATHERLNLYHRIATKQAQESFRRAQAAMITGFAIVAASVILSLLSRSVAASIATGILGAVAAALSGFISHTFIRSQESAAQHLRAYFLQPLEFSRYLVAERLLNTLKDDQKAEGILAIVQGIAKFSAIGGDTRITEDEPDQKVGA